MKYAIGTEQAAAIEQALRNGDQVEVQFKHQWSKNRYLFAITQAGVAVNAGSHGSELYSPEFRGSLQQLLAFDPSVPAGTSSIDKAFKAPAASIINKQCHGNPFIVSLYFQDQCDDEGPATSFYYVATFEEAWVLVLKHLLQLCDELLEEEARKAIQEANYAYSTVDQESSWWKTFCKALSKAYVHQESQQQAEVAAAMFDLKWGTLEGELNKDLPQGFDVKLDSDYVVALRSSHVFYKLRRHGIMIGTAICKLGQEESWMYSYYMQQVCQHRLKSGQEAVTKMVKLAQGVPVA